VQDRDTVTTER